MDYENPPIDADMALLTYLISDHTTVDRYMELHTVFPRINAPL